jgi:Chromate transporter
MRQFGFGAALCGALLAWLGMFLPGLLIKTAVLPLWRRYRGFPTMKVSISCASMLSVITGETLK